MARRKTPSGQDMIAALAELGHMRVWSLIVTVFGDAVAPRGGALPSVALQAILDRMGIRPEAMRVALHRLVKDGWIERRRSGRQSTHALTRRGRAEFLAASRRIYAKAPALHGPWTLAALPQVAEPERRALAERMRVAGFVALSPSAFLGPAGARCPMAVAAATLEGAEPHLPGWAREAIAPRSLNAEYAALESVLAQGRGVACADPLDAVALRVLIVHHWRRLLLRHADLPPELLPKGWRGEAVRALMLALHADLSALADPWLDQAIGPLRPETEAETESESESGSETGAAAPGR